jgi:tRNA(His) 5'-end guanylyltransferase
MPVLLRVDGKCFSRYTKPLEEPFDEDFIDAMNLVGHALCEEIQGAQLAFVQSDEVSVLIHPGVEFMREPDELSARIAFIDFNGAEVLDSVYENGLDEQVILDGCSHTIQAMKELADWTKAL